MLIGHNSSQENFLVNYINNDKTRNFLSLAPYIKLLIG